MRGIKTLHRLGDARRSGAGGVVPSTPYTGVAIPVNRLSVAVSAVLGVPGVTLLVLLDLL